MNKKQYNHLVKLYAKVCNLKKEIKEVLDKENKLIREINSLLE